jgi:hypothetical protein
MQASDPQIIYMALILPLLFGVTLVGEGVYKLTQDRAVGWFNLLMGLVFMSAVIGGYLLLAGVL